MRKISESLQKPFLLNGKRVLTALVLELVFIVLHNLVSAAISMEEGFFFLLAVIVIPLYLLMALIYTLVFYLKKNGKTAKKTV